MSFRHTETFVGALSPWHKTVCFFSALSSMYFPNPLSHFIFKPNEIFTIFQICYAFHTSSFERDFFFFLPEILPQPLDLVFQTFRMHLTGQKAFAKRGKKVQKPMSLLHME